MLLEARHHGIKTWVSLEPVLDAQTAFQWIEYGQFIDDFKIGKLNYFASDINWAAFGKECERLCIKHGRSYTIKNDLREIMNREELPHDHN